MNSRKRLGGDTKKARAMERAMFLNTPAILLRADYEDPEQALNEALRQLAMSVVRKQIRREGIQQDKFNRIEYLQKLLGQDKFKEATDLAREIESIRLQRASLGCTQKECKIVNETLQELPGTTIPSPVKQLFFNNRLYDVLLYTPLETLSELDLDGLIESAKEDLREYRDWSSSCSPSNDGNEPTKQENVDNPDNDEVSPPQMKRLRRTTVSIEDDEV